jgi:hypothetical protein
MKPRTPAKRGILSRVIKGNKSRVQDVPQPQGSSSQDGRADDVLVAPYVAVGIDGPRKRAIARYIEATRVIKQTIEVSQESWGLQSLTSEAEVFDDTETELKSKINLALAWKGLSINDRNLWSKCKQTIESMFTALNAQARLVRTIVNEFQSGRFPSKLSSNYQCRYLRFVHTS